MRKVRSLSPTNSPSSTTTSIILPSLSLTAKEITRSFGGKSASKLNSIPDTWGKLPGVAPSSVSATLCSITASNSSAVRVSSVKPLLNRRLLEISNWEISPSSLPANSLAGGGTRSKSSGSVAPGGTITSPISSRIPPPFLIEITTSESMLWA